MSVFIPARVSTIYSVPDLQSNPFVTGFELAVTGNTTFTLQPGAARALTSDNVIQYPGILPGLPEFITVDVSEVGANGCYPVSIASLGLANNTLFPVYVMENSSGTTGGSLNNNVAPVAVVATGDKFLLPNMDSYRRIGWVYINSDTGNLIPMYQSGHANDRTYLLDADVIVLSAGNATTSTGIDLTANDGFIPPYAGIQIYLGYTIQGNAAGAYARFIPTGGGAGTMSGVITPVATQSLGVSGVAMTGLNIDGNASIDYLVNDAGTTVTVVSAGFVDSLDANLV